MPVLRSSNRLRGSATIYCSSATSRPTRLQLTPPPLGRRPIRHTRRALEGGYSAINVSYTSSAAASSPSTPATSEYKSSSDFEGSDRSYVVESSPSTTPPITPTPSDFTPMSLATSAPGHRTRPASPTTPTPTERNGTSVSGLQRSYAMIFSPEDQGIAPDLSPSLSVSSMDTESASEHIPQATLRSLFDTPMNMDDGEVEPGYGKMSRIRRFKLNDVAFEKFNPDCLPEPDESLLTRLDCLVNAGLSPPNFQKIFAECEKCNALTARRNVHFHSCAAVQASRTFAPLDRASLLHCTGTEGLKPESFEDLMSYCEDCDKFMTYRSSLHHDCVLFKLTFGEEVCEEMYSI